MCLCVGMYGGREEEREKEREAGRQGDRQTDSIYSSSWPVTHYRQDCPVAHRGLPASAS